MSAIIAPQRGGNGVGTVTTDTTAAVPYTNVLSMAGSKQFASWEGGSIDMTSCIAGGAGAKQNEFYVSMGAAVSSGLGDYQFENVSVVPATFAVSGNNSTSALRGTKVHALIADMKFDLIDFIGGNVNLSNVGVKTTSALRVALSSSGSRHESKPRLGDTDGDAKEGKEKKDCKQIDKELVKYCGLSAGIVTQFLGDDCKSDKLKLSAKGSLEEVNSTAAAFATKQTSGSMASSCDSQPMDLSESTLLKKGYVRLSQK